MKKIKWVYQWNFLSQASFKLMKIIERRVCLHFDGKRSIIITLSQSMAVKRFEKNYLKHHSWNDSTPHLDMSCPKPKATRIGWFEKRKTICNKIRNASELYYVYTFWWECISIQNKNKKKIIINKNLDKPKNLWRQKVKNAQLHRLW